MKTKVTVILAVYNSEKYLKESIDSILNQTFKDFELLIINDGSTDSSSDIIKSYTDNRIIVVNQTNQGLAASLNKSIELSRGEYIARMDHDDISCLERLETQVSFMDRHPEIGVCGAWADLINNEGEKIGKATYPLYHDQMETFLLFNSPLCHPSVILRKEVLIANNLKYNLIKTEDFDLWIRLVKVTKFANIPKTLIKYRFGVGYTAVRYKNECDKCFEELVNKQVLRLMPEASKEDLRTHYSVADFHYQPDKEFLLLVVSWLDRIRQANKKNNLYKQEALDFVLARQWFSVCTRCRKQTLLSLKFCLYSLSLFFRLSNSNKLMFLRMLIKI